MIQTLARNWILLIVCGVLDAMIAVIYLSMWDTDGPITFHSWGGTVVLLGKLAVAAGLCAMAASFWRSSDGRCWLLALHGFALGALGLIQYGFTRFRISFLTVSLLIAVMAVSIGMLEMALAQALRRHPRSGDRWFLAPAGVVSGGFALAFLTLGFRWIGVGPGSHVDLLWLGSYFGFSSICMLALALRLHGHDLSGSRGAGSLPPLGYSRQTL